MACIPHLNGNPTTYDAIKKQLLQDRNLLSKYVPNAKTDVPSMPFAGQGWKQLGLKIALRKAAESGANELGWTTGEQQAERYDLSKQIDELQYSVNQDQTFNIKAIKNGDVLLQKQDLNSKSLEDHIGKDIARKIQQRSEQEDSGTLTDVDLKVGGEGMKGFYDKELVNLANDLVKKWGVRVGESSLNTNPTYNVLNNRGTAIRQAMTTRAAAEKAMKQLQKEYPRDTFEVEDNSEKQSVHSLPITDAMRRDILERGQPMFMPSTPKHLDSIAKELGLRYDGPSLGGKALQFTDEKTKSSLDVPADATPEELRKLIDTSRKDFKR